FVTAGSCSVVPSHRGLGSQEARLIRPPTHRRWAFAGLSTLEGLEAEPLELTTTGSGYSFPSSKAFLSSKAETRSFCTSTTEGTPSTTPAPILGLRAVIQGTDFARVSRSEVQFLTSTITMEFRLGASTARANAQYTSRTPVSLRLYSPPSRFTPSSRRRVRAGSDGFRSMNLKTLP